MNSVSPVSTACGCVSLVFRFVNDDGNRFRSVARRFERLQAHATELENLTVVKRGEGVRRFRRGAQINCRAGAIAQLDMPGHEISVQMRQKYVLDRKRMVGGKRNVLVRVPLRVNNRCSACFLVSNQVRSVCQARQVELLEDHLAPSSLADCYFGWGTIRR